jgi:glycosyltransferase involved in cell wall biosynthesis
VRVLMISHSAVAGGANNVVVSLLRHAPADLEDASWIFLESGEMMGFADVPTALIDAGRARHFWKAPRTVSRLRRAIRESRADLVFAHVTKAHLYASVAARLEHVPYMWWQQERYGQKPVMHQVAGRLRAGVVLCAAEHTAAEQRVRFPKTPVAMVPLGVRVDPAAPGREHREKDAVVLGVVGRLQRWKRVELALRAMPAVLAALPGARLRVLGSAAPGLDEDYPAELEAEAEELGIADRVDFLGHVEDGAAAIRELDVLVHCAEVEPFGLVPIEGMIAGVPVVVPDEGGPRETVRQGIDGLRVDPTDRAALAEAIVALGRDADRRAQMGAAGRERALANYTDELMARRAWAAAAAVVAGRDPREAVAQVASEPQAPDRA